MSGAKIRVDREISLKVALVLIALTIIIVVVIGFFIGNRFFWNRFDTKVGIDRDLERIQLYAETHPKDPNAHVALGAQLLVRKKQQEAIKEFEKAYALDKHSQTVRFSLGFAYRDIGQYQKAVSVLQPLVKEFPFYFLAQYNLGLTYQKMQQFDKAVIAYESALRINPGAADVYLDLARTYSDMGKIKEAEESVDKALRFVPNYAEALKLKNKLEGR